MQERIVVQYLEDDPRYVFTLNSFSVDPLENGWVNSSASIGQTLGYKTKGS